MSTRRYQTFLQFIRDVFVLNGNRMLGREHIPDPREILCVETSSMCNLKCRFCPYFKKKSPKVSMPDDFFFDCIDQAVEMGIRRFQLTPCTGDVFMDRSLFTKLDFLDAHPKVDRYDFFTNFTIPDEGEIERLVHLKKLGSLTASIYGHDLASFVAITQSTEKVYRRLIRNLTILRSRLDKCKFRVALGLRTYSSMHTNHPSELVQLIREFKAAGVSVNRSRVYNNWGGYITNEDVQGLDIDVTGADATYKNGACAMLTSRVQVLASGIVNGCACRDVEATLQIGDLRQQRLRDILSTRNKRYMQLIRDQQEGRFPEICQSCDFYKSIYLRRPIYKKARLSVFSMAAFMQLLHSPPDNHPPREREQLSKAA